MPIYYVKRNVTLGGQQQTFPMHPINGHCTPNKLFSSLLCLSPDLLAACHT